MERERAPSIVLPIVAALLGLLGIVGAVTYYGSQQIESSVVDLDIQAPAILNSITNPGELAASSTVIEAPAEAAVQPFESAAYLAARAMGKVVFLYFSAPWCPECGFGEERLKKAIKGQSPDDLAVFLVDFGAEGAAAEELELAQNLEVTAPETKIIFKGNKLILNSTEMWSSDRFVTELATALGK